MISDYVIGVCLIAAGSHLFFAGNLTQAGAFIWMAGAVFALRGLL